MAWQTVALPPAPVKTGFRNQVSVVHKEGGSQGISEVDSDRQAPQQADSLAQHPPPSPPIQGGEPPYPPPQRHKRQNRAPACSPEGRKWPFLGRRNPRPAGRGRGAHKWKILLVPANHSGDEKEGEGINTPSEARRHTPLLGGTAGQLATAEDNKRCQRPVGVTPWHLPSP